MSVHKFHPKLHARTVEECWNIARAEASAYQRIMLRLAKKRHSQTFYTCKAARDAASRIALKIRFGRRRREK